MSTEKEIQTAIMASLGGRPDVRLFRNNCGLGFVGKLVSNKNGVVTLMGARPLHAGLHAGSADLIGWRTVEITPEMVGRKIAVFLSVECKSDSGRPSPAQMIWADVVKRFGGLAGIARNVQDAENILVI